MCRCGCAQCIQWLYGTVHHTWSNQCRFTPLSHACPAFICHIMAARAAVEHHQVPAGAVQGWLSVTFCGWRTPAGWEGNDSERLSSAVSDKPTTTWHGAFVGLHGAGGDLHGAVCLSPFDWTPAWTIADVAWFHDSGSSASVRSGTAVTRVQYRSGWVCGTSGESPCRQSAAVREQLSTDRSQRMVGCDWRCTQCHWHTAGCCFSWWQFVETICCCCC